MYLNKGLYNKAGLFVRKGLFIGRGLMSKVAGFFDYYQWLKLDEVVDDEYLDYGTGDNNATVVSGTMEDKDLALNVNPNSDVGIKAVLDNYGIPNPVITYAEMKAINTGDQKEKFNTLFKNITDIKNIYGFNTTSSFNAPNLTGFDNIQSLFFGQSNIATRDYVGDLSEFDTTILDKIFFMSKDDLVWKSPSVRLAEGNLRIGELNYAYTLSQLSGKSVYVTNVTAGGTGFSSTPSWLVSAEEYAKDTVETYNAGKALITGTRIGLSAIWNLGEYDSNIEANAITSKQNLYDLMQYVWTQTSDNLIPIFYQLNKYSYAVTDGFGSVINAGKNELINRPNDLLYLGGGFVQYVDDEEFNIEDRVHYTDASYKSMYIKTAYLSMNKMIDNQQVDVNNNPNIRLSENLTLPNSLYSKGAKTIIVHLNHQLSTSIQRVITNYDGVSGFELRYLANANFISLRLYEASTLIVNSSSIKTFVGDGKIGFTWDGTTNAQSLSILSQEKGDYRGLFETPITPSALETSDNATDIITKLLNRDLYKIYFLDRKLTTSELDLVSENRENEINWTDYYSLSEGFGTSLYSKNGLLATTAAGVSWSNNSYVPDINLSANNEIQTNGSSYRHVPIGTTEIGWTKVENVDVNKFYDIFGSSIKLPEIKELRDIDFDNIFYDTDGMAKEVTGAELRAVSAVYLTITSDNISITSIKLADIIIPASDFSINNAGDAIKDWALQPYTNYQVIEGNYQVIEGNYTIIKTF